MRTRALMVLALLAAALPVIPASAGTHEVQIRDNFFEPQRIFVDRGDTVTWDGGGFRPHTVTSDTGRFDSGQLSASDEFSFTFDRAGSYYYHCRFHGAARRGMWGVVVVGDPPKDERKKIFVPDDYPSIQEAVGAAEPGAVVVVRPGEYAEEVVVATDRVVLRGVDRFRTVLDGGDVRDAGITVTGDDVVVKNLTVRDYTSTGIAVDGVDGFTIRRVDLIRNTVLGVDADGARGGSIERVFAWGSGEAGIRVGRCFACGLDVTNVQAGVNLLGIEVVNATGVTVRGSRLAANGVGLLAHSDGAEGDTPGRALFVYGNDVSGNNQAHLPGAGLAAVYGLPFGTGIWLAGVSNSAVLGNEVHVNDRYGVLVTDGLQGIVAPSNNRVQGNVVLGGESSLDLAWDGSGASNCFDGNSATTSGPAFIQDRYPCRLRPFTGTAYAPVRDDVDAAVARGPETDTQGPGTPARPRCQRGKPGCRR